MGQTTSKTKPANSTAVYSVGNQNVQLQTGRNQHSNPQSWRNGRDSTDLSDTRPFGLKKPGINNSTSDYGSSSFKSRFEPEQNTPCEECLPNGMTDLERQRITGSFRLLTEQLEPSIVIDGLFTDNIIDDHDMEELQCIGARYRRVQCLMLKLLRSNKNTAFPSFMKHLKSEQEYLHDEVLNKSASNISTQMTDSDSLMGKLNKHKHVFNEINPDDVASALFESGLLNTDQYENILNSSNLMQEKRAWLWDHIVNNLSQSYGVMCEVLSAKHRPDVARCLLNITGSSLTKINVQRKCKSFTAVMEADISAPGYQDEIKAEEVIYVRLANNQSNTYMTDDALRREIAGKKEVINSKLMKDGIGTVDDVKKGSIILIITLNPSFAWTPTTRSAIVGKIFKILDSIFESLDKSDVITRNTEFDILFRPATDGCKFTRHRQFLRRELQPFWLLKQSADLDIFDDQDESDIRAEKSREAAANKMVDIIACKSQEKQSKFRLLLKSTSPYIFERIWGVKDQTDESNQREPTIETRIGTLSLEPIRLTSATPSLKCLAGCLFLGCFGGNLSNTPSA